MADDSAPMENVYFKYVADADSGNQWKMFILNICNRSGDYSYYVYFKFRAQYCTFPVMDVLWLEVCNTIFLRFNFLIDNNLNCFEIINIILRIGDT